MRKLPTPIRDEEGKIKGLEWDGRNAHGVEGRGVWQFSGQSKRLSFRVPESWADTLDYLSALTEIGGFQGKSEPLTQTEIHRHVFFLGYKVFVLREAKRFLREGVALHEIALRLNMDPRFLAREMRSLGLPVPEEPDTDRIDLPEPIPEKSTSELSPDLQEQIRRSIHGS